MAIFVRKNILVATAMFTANDGTATQPSSASLVVSYTAPVGPAQQTIAMTYDAVSKKWMGEWDSSEAVEGPVEWMIYGVGALQAAAQGRFQVTANKANTE